jgi:hypothetical protein
MLADMRKGMGSLRTRTILGRNVRKRKLILFYYSYISERRSGDRAEATSVGGG